MVWAPTYPIFNNVAISPSGALAPFDINFSEYMTNVTLDTGTTSMHVTSLTSDGYSKMVNRIFEKPTLKIDFVMANFPAFYKTVLNARQTPYDILFQFYTTDNQGGQQLSCLAEGVFFDGLSVDVALARESNTLAYSTNIIRFTWL